MKKKFMSLVFATVLLTPLLISGNANAQGIPGNCEPHHGECFDNMHP
ncbi:hypothetical protein [Jeotgalibacillus marinus]|uniref:Uncharacterized protein n=1 Tax=Jeotgalibacillus marinus TaxID=86667 RepID=A0ABV3Q682_9BACL